MSIFNQILTAWVKVGNRFVLVLTHHRFGHVRWHFVDFLRDSLPISEVIITDLSICYQMIMGQQIKACLNFINLHL